MVKDKTNPDDIEDEFSGWIPEDDEEIEFISWYNQADRSFLASPLRMPNLIAYGETREQAVQEIEEVFYFIVTRDNK